MYEAYSIHGHMWHLVIIGTVVPRHDNPNFDIQRTALPYSENKCKFV